MLEGLAGNKLKTLATTCLDTCLQAERELMEKGTPADKFLAEFYRALKEAAKAAIIKAEATATKSYLVLPRYKG